LKGDHAAAPIFERSTPASNPLLLIAISRILGGVLGYLMGQLSAALKPKLTLKKAWLAA